MAESIIKHSIAQDEGNSDDQHDHGISLFHQSHLLSIDEDSTWRARAAAKQLRVLAIA